jgi:flagellar biosynthesis component FlhA
MHPMIRPDLWGNNAQYRRFVLSEQVEAILATQVESVIRVHVGSLDGWEEEKLSDDVREKLFFQTGIVFPPLEFESDGHLAVTEFRLALNGLWTPVTPLERERPADSLVKLLRNHGPLFTTTTVVDAALGRLAKAFPMVVFNTIEVFGTTSALRIIRALVDEGVDIRDLHTILGAMLEANGTLPARHEHAAVFLPYEATFLPEVPGGDGRARNDPYVSCVRVQLRDQISQACADSKRVLHEIRLAATLETRLSKLDHVPLGEDETFELLTAATRAARDGPIGTVFLASSRHRRRLWELIHHELPHVPVLCEAEISPYVEREKAGEIEAV